MFASIMQNCKPCDRKSAAALVHMILGPYQRTEPNYKRWNQTEVISVRYLVCTCEELKTEEPNAQPYREFFDCQMIWGISV